ncbi:UNVERIFIED_CONTAM: hypothetical protein GTU68_034432 [Idotea baltica]|nr:hypothetical protein [Idotea baltica]
MTASSISLQQKAKELVGKAIADRVSSGDCLGLGTGSTATCAINAIGTRIASGEIENISGLPTSTRTRDLAKSVGIKIITVDSLNGKKLDWGFDGADEIVLSSGWAIKGGGGAMTSEKAVAKLCEKLILIVDESKVSEVLGEKWSVPIEIYEGTSEEVFKDLESLGATAYTQRLGEDSGLPYITEHGNHIIDVAFSNFDQGLERLINQANSNIVENGLFTSPGESLASEILVARSDGRVDTTELSKKFNS